MNTQAATVYGSPYDDHAVTIVRVNTPAPMKLLVPFYNAVGALMYREYLLDTSATDRVIYR